MLEYILFSNNYCKHSKTVIKIKFTKVKDDTVHSHVKYTLLVCYAVQTSNKTNNNNNNINSIIYIASIPYSPL